MPNSVDTRIVEMQFDNAKFERNIRQSMNSLNELDKALQMKDGVKGFEKIEKAADKMDFSKMEKSLSFLEYRFSALGMTAAKIIDRTTTKIGNLFSKIESMTLGQMKSGGMARALKLEHANFMLDGILKNAEQVKEIMDKAVSPAVDGTAYGLDAAANAASQFVASGIQDIDKLKTALTGISGVAAMSGSSYEEISRIFTKVAASGRMMGDEVLQLSTRGINAQAELAKYLKKTTAEVQEMQKKGQISFEIFANAMNDAFGEQAKKANETYTGAMSNLKAALSRIGADFATPYINNMRDIFNALRLTVNDIRKALAPLVELWTEGITGLKTFVEELTQNEKFVNIYTNTIKILCNGVRVLSNLLYPLREGFKKAFPEGMVGIISDVTTKISDLFYKLEIRTSALRDLSDAVGGIISILKLISYTIGQLTGSSKPLILQVNTFLGITARVLGVLGKYITKGVELIINNKKQISVLKILKSVILLVIAAIIKIGSYVGSLIKDFSELPIVQEIFDNIYNSAVSLANYALPLLAGAAGAIVSAFKYLIDLGKSGFFGDIFSQINDKIKGFHKAVTAGSGVLTSFGNIFSGGFTKLPTTITAFAKSLDNANEVVSDTVKPGGLLPGLHTLHEALTNFSGGINKVLDDIVTAAKKFGVARGLIVGVGASLLSFLYHGAGLAKNFKKAFAGIPGVISALKNNLNANIFDVKAKAIILGLAVAIGSLTVSLVALSLVDSRKLREASISLSILVGVMTVAGIAINKLGDGFKGFKAVAFSFISFAGAVGVLALALEVLANIDLDFGQLMLRVVALGTIMAALGGVVIAMTRWSKPFSVLLGSGFMLAFALAIKMLVTSLGALADMDVDNINAALPALLKMMGALALIGAACTALSPFAGVGFLGIVGGVTAFILALTGLAEILDPEKFSYIHQLLVDIYNMIKTWLIIFAIATLIKQLTIGWKSVVDGINLLRKGIEDFKTATTKIGPEIAKALAGPLQAIGNAMTIATLVGGFILIATAIKQLGKLPDDQFLAGCDKAMFIAIGITGFIAAVMILQKLLLGKKQFLAGLEKIAFSMAALIASLTLSMKLISEIPSENLDQAIFTVGTLMLIIVGFEAITAILAKDSKAMQIGIKTALSLSIFITALTLCVGLLSMLAEEDWVPIIAAAGAVALVMVGVAAICWAMSQVKTGPAIAASVGIVAVIVAVAAAMYAIQQIEINDNYVQVFMCLIVSIGYMAAIFAALSLIKPAQAVVAFAALAVIGALFWGMAEVMKIIETIDTDYDFANTLIAMGIALGYMTGIVISLGVMWQYTLVGLACLAVLELLMYALARVADTIVKINGKAFWDNCVILGKAVGALALIVTILGGALLGTGGSLAVIMLAGAAALLVFAGVMYVVGSVGNYFAEVMTNIATAVDTFAPAITNLGNALQSFAKADLDGTTMNLLSAIEVIGGLGLVSGDLLLVAAGVQALADGMSVLHDTSDQLKTNLDALDKVVPGFKDHVETLKTTFKDLSQILQNGIDALSDTQIYATVTSLADAMKEHSEADFNSLGIVMIGHICDGMQSEIEESVPPIMGDICSGLESGSTDAEGRCKALGIVLAQAMINGFRGPEGIDSNSPAKAFIDIAVDCIGGLTRGVQDNLEKVKKGGAAMGAALEEGCRGPNGVDAHSNSWKFIEIAKDCIGGLCAPFFGDGKKDIEKAGAEGGETLVDATKKKLEEKLPGLTETIKNWRDQAQDWVANNPIIQEIVVAVDDPTGLLDGSGLTEKQLAGAKTEDRKRYSMMGYNNIQDLTRAGQAGLLDEEMARRRALREKNAVKQETDALTKNTKATGGNSKAKAENEKANDGKTKAIDEETESLGEEEEAVEDNSDAIREMAEQIEVVTEKYNTLKNATSWFGDKFKIARKSLVLMGDAFHAAFRTMEKDSDGTEKVAKKSVQEIYNIFYGVRKNIKHTTDRVAKGLYAFSAETDKYDKKLTKKLKKGSQSVKKAEKTVLKTGKTIVKVYEGYMKVFTKSGNGVEKMVLRLTKKVKNMASFAREATNFVKNFNMDINKAQYVEDFTDNFRQIEKFFVKRKDMPQKIQNWLGDILTKFKDAGFKNTMNLLGKSIDGVGDYWKSTAQNTAYVADSMTQLAAALYDGSDAANQYWTEIARLEFLVEHNEATLEELEEARRAYLDRAMEALKEYYTTIQETLGGQFNPFQEFDKKTEDATKDLIGCLESQIAGFQTYGDMLIALAQRGADFNLMKDLADQGVEAYGIIENLVTMTEGQLALYNQYYRQIDSVKQRAADATIAALANARTMASIRAAARSGNLSDKQMKQQKKLAGEMADDMKAVANAVAYGYKDAKKQQKEYMKSLTKEEKKQYKKQLKNAKQAAELEKQQAEAEKKARAQKKAEEERLDSIMKSIKGYESLISVIDKYNNDAAVMEKVNEGLNKSLKSVYKYIDNNQKNTKNWLSFSKILGVDEDAEDADSYFSSLESAITSFMDGLKDALYDFKNIFQKFTESVDKLNMNNMFSNATSQIRATEKFGAYFDQLVKAEYNQDSLNYFIEKFKSDKAGALDEMAALLSGTEAEIKEKRIKFNYVWNRYKEVSEENMKKITQGISDASHEDAQQLYDAAKAEADAAQARVDALLQGSGDYVRQSHAIIEKIRIAASRMSGELSNIDRNDPNYGSNLELQYSQITSEFSESLRRIQEIQGGSTEQRLEAIRALFKSNSKFLDAYNYYQNKYADRAEEIEREIRNKERKLESDPHNGLLHMQIDQLKSELQQINDAYANTIGYIYEQAQAEVQSEYDAAVATAQAKSDEANSRKAALEAIVEENKAMDKEAEVLFRYENALYSAQILLTEMGETYENFGKVMEDHKWTQDYITKATQQFRDALIPVSNSIRYATYRFADWGKASGDILINLTRMDEAFLKFASTLDKTNAESSTFMEDLGSRLEEYRKTLDDTIRGQTQLFEEFKKYSGDEPTAATTYLDNMISQTQGLADWLDNLETLAGRGVAKEVVQMFASEGQASYEKVEAFAKASESELAELNKRYADYAKLAAEAADRALAAVASTYTYNAEKMQKDLLESFKERAKSNIEEAAYEAATMVVTGIKDGINKARPQLVAEIDGVATAISSTVAKTLTASEIEESIRKGLNTMSGTLQNSVGVIVTDFLDKVTQTSVSKFKMAVDQCRAYVEKNLPKDYTITIHVDTSEMDAAVARMNYAINGMNYVAVQTSASVAQSQANQSQGNEVTVGAVPTNNTTVNYTQNNYSPTALSRTEIYRQTQNQLQTIRGVVSAS